MAVLREFRCAAHGSFVADEPLCPKGCRGTFITREFLTPPGYKSAKTKFADQTFRRTAAQLGLTDMSNKDGRSVMENARKNTPDEFRARFAPVPKGGTFDVRNMKPTQATGGALAALAEHKGKPDDAMSEVKSVLEKPKPQLLYPNWGEPPKAK